VVSTWTAANADIKTAYDLLQDKRVRSVRFIVDYSFRTRQPEYCEALRDRFGDDAIRVTSTHAKFTLITNETWKLVLRTSMNLNLNPRFENFELSDDQALSDFMAGMVDEIWRSHTVAQAFGDRPYDHKQRFKGIFDEAGAGVTAGLKTFGDLT
jgi:hypothetical protein